MGSGKTTVGQWLARQLAWRFDDLDARIEQSAGIGIPEIFERLGEPAFREMEQVELGAALGRAAESQVGVVLALGGGTYAQPGVVAALRAAAVPVVWIDCPLPLLLERCAAVTNRPLFRDAESFEKLLETRLPYYRQADHRVVGDTEPARVVEQILALPIFASRLSGIAGELSLDPSEKIPTAGDAGKRQ